MPLGYFLLQFKKVQAKKLLKSNKSISRKKNQKFHEFFGLDFFKFSGPLCFLI